MAPYRNAALAALLALTVAAPAPTRAAPDPLSAMRARLPQDEVIYFLLPDRFDNADPGNDRGGLAGDRLVTGFDPTDKGFYHGGDLKGVTRRLGYIQDLGATAIWLGPVSGTSRCRARRGTSRRAITVIGSPTSRMSTRIWAPIRT